MAPLKALGSVHVGPFHLRVQEVALQAARVVLPHLRSVPAAYRELGDQATRAVTSVSLNLAEGSGRLGRDCQNHFRISYGSALEASAALELLVAVSAIPEAAAAEALRLLDSTRAVLWRLLHPR